MMVWSEVDSGVLKVGGGTVLGTVGEEWMEVQVF